MQINYQILEKLPPLAWIACVSNGNCMVLCGLHVEKNDTFFVEGAWSGKFTKGNFINCDWFCGSGAKVNGNKIVFSTPSHVTSALFSYYSDNGYVVSNSLYLLLALEGLHLDTQYIGYEKDFNSILDGIYKYKNYFHVDQKHKVEIHYFRNIEISDNGDVEIIIKKNMKPFGSFIEYETKLKQAINDMANNSKDGARRVKYDLVTTISKGYDAPCCAVIAKNAGCDTAVTFKAEGKYAEDSGTEIAKMIGYENIIEKDALEYLNRTDLVEAEYICSGELGAQISFSTFDEYFKNKLVFTGERGDSVWGINNPICNDEFHFIDVLNHLGSCERKLWLGYISVPMPLFGASTWTSIQMISQSEEMSKWSLNNEYDRPIPRRICEEAGVPREMFGISKHGAGFLYRYDWMKRIKNRMSQKSGDDFERYVKENSKYSIKEWIVFIWKIKNLYIRKLGIKVKVPSTEELREVVNPTAVRYLIPWAGDHMIEKYKLALNNGGETNR